MRFLLLPPLLALLASSAPAQCGIAGISTQGYGQGCSPVFGTGPTIAARFDPSTCTMSIQVTAFPGCCNTYLVNRLLAIGDQPTNLPLPQFGAGCALLVQSFAVLLQAGGTGDVFTFALPPGLQPGAFYAQGAAHYFTTIGFGHDLAFTDGLQINLL